MSSVDDHMEEVYVCFNTTSKGQIDGMDERTANTHRLFRHILAKKMGLAEASLPRPCPRCRYYKTESGGVVDYFQYSESKAMLMCNNNNCLYPLYSYPGAPLIPKAKLVIERELLSLESVRTMETTTLKDCSPFIDSYEERFHGSPSLHTPLNDASPPPEQRPDVVQNGLSTQNCDSPPPLRPITAIEEQERVPAPVAVLDLDPEWLQDSMVAELSQGMAVGADARSLEAVQQPVVPVVTEQFSAMETQQGLDTSEPLTLNQDSLPLSNSSNVIGDEVLPTMTPVEAAVVTPLVEEKSSTPVLNQEENASGPGPVSQGSPPVKKMFKFNVYKEQTDAQKKVSQKRKRKSTPVKPGVARGSFLCKTFQSIQEDVKRMTEANQKAAMLASVGLIASEPTDGSNSFRDQQELISAESVPRRLPAQMQKSGNTRFAGFKATEYNSSSRSSGDSSTDAQDPLKKKLWAQFKKTKKAEAMAQRPFSQLSAYPTYHEDPFQVLGSPLKATTPLLERTGQVLEPVDFQDSLLRSPSVLVAPSPIRTSAEAPFTQMSPLVPASGDEFNFPFQDLSSSQRNVFLVDNHTTFQPSYNSWENQLEDYFGL